MSGHRTKFPARTFIVIIPRGPSCNSWSTLDLRFITVTALVPHVRQPGHVFQYSLSSQEGSKRLCAKPISSSFHQRPQPGLARSQFHIASRYLSLARLFLPQYQSREYPRKPPLSLTKLLPLTLKPAFDICNQSKLFPLEISCG